MEDADKLLVLADAELERSGVYVVKVSDGHVFFFTAERLESLRLLADDSETGRIMLFVKSGKSIAEVKLN